MYDFFGSSYDDFMIVNILDKNIVVYNNINNFIFYRPNSEQKYGMIISNGISKPFVTYNPEKYLEKIKNYLKIENADYVVPKTKNEKNTSEYVKEMMRIMALNFKVDKKYADLVIKNSNTVHYLSPKKEDENCHFKKRKFEMFQDLEMKLKGSYGANYFYDKNNKIMKLQNTINDSITDELNYQTDEFGLLTYQKDKNNNLVTAVYIYQIDKFYVVYLQDEEPISYETFYLNDKKQCYNRTSFREDKSKIWDITYFYDIYGRIAKEINKDEIKTYLYRNKTDDYYSELICSVVSKISYRYKVRREKNINYFTEKNYSGKTINTSKTITSQNCDTQTFSYDAEMNLISVAVVKSVE